MSTFEAFIMTSQQLKCTIGGSSFGPTCGRLLDQYVLGMELYSSRSVMTLLGFVSLFMGSRRMSSEVRSKVECL